MTSDRDIEQYVEQHYNPDIATPQEYMNSTNWGSGSRQQVAFRRAESLYHDYELSRGISEEELQEEKDKLEAQEQSETEQQSELEQSPEEQEQQEQDIFDRASNFIRGILRGLFSS